MDKIYSFFNSNKEIIIGILIMVIILLFTIFFTKKTVVNDSDNIIKKSLIPDSGNGVFAQKDYKKGDIVERCQILLDYTDEIGSTIINDYSWGDEHNGQQVTVIPITGKCNLFNHSDDYNVEVDYDLERKTMKCIATKDIKKGEEMYISYGDGYWDSRQKNTI